MSGTIITGCQMILISLECFLKEEKRIRLFSIYNVLKLFKVQIAVKILYEIGCLKSRL